MERLMELIFEKTLKNGIKAHKSGQVQEAVRLYLAILESQPEHPEVNHSMGLLAVKMEDALRFFKVALESDPSVDQFWLSYINALIKFERITDAKAMFARAKEKGISGEAFDMMGQKLFTNNKTDLVKRRAFKSNILDTVKLDKALRLASKNKKNDQIEKAKDIYQDILKKFPKHKQALAALKLLSGGTIPVLQDPPPNKLNSLINLYNQGQLKLALLHTSQLLESYPRSVILYNLSGASNAGLMQFDAAIKSYKQALKIKPDYVDALNNMGVAQNSQGDAEAAIQSYKSAIKIKPDYADALNNMGVAQNSQGDAEAAIQSYKSAIKIKPDYAEAHNNMGKALNSKGDQVEAIKSYAQAIKANPAYVDAHNNMGLVQKDRSNFKLAIKSFSQAIKIKPDYVEAYNNMGNTFQDKGDLEDAINCYNKALSIQPDYSAAHFNMGIALNGKNDPEAAINSYEQALKIQPDYIDAYNNLAIVFKNRGDLEAAINIYKQALKIKPDVAEVHFNLGVVLQDKGDLKMAINSYNKAVMIKPDYADAYNNMGLTLNHMGDLKAAIGSFKLAISIKLDYFEAYNNLGIALKDKGNLDDSIYSFKKALKIKPDHADAYFNMGNVLLEKGDLDAALESCKKALSYRPDYNQVWSNLEFLLQAIKLKVPNVDLLFQTNLPESSSKHTQILKSVLRYSLYLGGEHAKASLYKVCGLLSTADNKIIKNPEVSNNAERQEIIEPDKVVALVHFGRSGTGLLHSLIDNHPEISTMPSIYFSEFFNHSTWEYIISEGWSKMIDRFVANYEVLFDASVRSPIETKSKKHITYMGQKEGMANVGNQQNEVLRLDKVLFCEELCRLMKPQKHLDTFTFFWLVHLAYNKALDDRNHKHLIFYHIHNPDTYAQLNFVQAVPNANWVMMVREPIQACESWIRNGFYENKYIDVVSKIITMLFAIDNSIYYQQNSIGVRLEDLKESPSTTIPALCDWMGIEETESLYEMTAQGKKWWGDPGSPDFEKDGMEPFGKTSIERTLGSIFTVSDQFILRTLFYPISVRFGYVEENLEQFKEDLKTIRPMLDRMFDFEIKMAQRMDKDTEQFMKSGYYLYLRSGLIDRWNMLAKWHTYPNMIKPLKINQ